MVHTVFAQKKDMRQIWGKDGKRVVVTQLVVDGNTVVRVLPASDTENKVQLGFGDKKMHNMNRAQIKQLEAANVTVGKRAFFETTATEALEAGRVLRVEEVFAPGDVIKVSGTSKGLGFAGVVKRWGFKGGPKTHGQSDRQRAPGSIGAGTTPGRVWKQKKMAGRGGNETITLEKVIVIAVNPDAQTVWVRGSIPGAYNSLLTLNKQNTTVPALDMTDVSHKLLDLPVAAAAQESAEETQS